MKKLIVIVLALLMFTVFAIPATAHAAAPTGNALAGVNITIVCPTTPATGHGRRGNNSYFVAADGRTLGVMSAADASAIRDRFAVTDANGNWLPPGHWPTLTGMEWSQWFAAEFNALRTTSIGAGQSAEPTSIATAERFTPEWIEAQRQEVVRLVNIERERAGLPRLEASASIMYAAQIRARELAVFYSHERPDGSRWRTVFEQAGVVERPNGENIHRAVHSAESAMNGWMRSQGHRNNLLNEQATAIGVGLYVDEAGRIFWVQVFGR